MSLRAALVVLVITALLAAGAFLALKKDARGVATPSKLLAFDEAALNSFSVSGPGRTTHVVSRGPTADLWLLRTDDGPSWPVGSKQVRGALGLLSGLESAERLRPYSPANDETVVRLESTASGTSEVLLAAQTLGGKGVVAAKQAFL